MIEESRIKEQTYLGNFVACVMVIMVFFTFLLSSVNSLVKQFGAGSIVSIPSLILMLVLFAITLKRSIYPLSFYGFTLHNWQKSLFESLLFTLPILFLSLLGKWLIINNVPQFYGHSLFSFGDVVVAQGSKNQDLMIWITLANIFISSPIQEILFRGALQSTFQVFFLGKYRFFLAILTTNLIFAMIHLILSFTLAVLAFVLGIFWSWMYKRHGTLIGVTVSHMIIGFWMFFILGVQRVIF